MVKEDGEDNGRFTYENLHKALRDYLVRIGNSAKTQKQNKANLEALIPEKVHEKIVEDLKTGGEFRQEDYISAIVEELKRSVKEVMENELSAATKASRGATGRNVLISQGINKKHAQELIPSINSYGIKKDIRTPIPIEDDEFEELEKVIDDKISHPRDSSQLYEGKRALVEYRLMFFGGLKPQEVARLLYKDISHSEKKVIVRHKKGEDRRVHPGESFFTAMKDYSDHHKNVHEDKPLEGGTAFRNRNGNKVSTRSLRRGLDYYLKKSNIDKERRKEIEPMCFRYAFARRIVQQGENDGEGDSAIITELENKLGVKYQRATVFFNSFKTA